MKEREALTTGAGVVGAGAGAGQLTAKKVNGLVATGTTVVALCVVRLGLRIIMKRMEDIHVGSVQ